MSCSQLDYWKDILIIIFKCSEVRSKNSNHRLAPFSIVLFWAHTPSWP